MRQLVRWFRSLTRIRYQYTDTFEQQQAHGLAVMCWSIIFVALLYLPSLPFNGMSEQLNRQFTFSVAAVVIGMGLVLLLLNRGSLLGASVTYVLLMYVATLAVVLRYIPAPTGANLLPFMVPIIAAGVLLNRRGIAAVIGLILLTLLAVRLVSVFGLPTSVVLMPPTPTEETWLNVIWLLASGMMLVVFTGGQRALLRRNVRLTRDLRSSTIVSKALAETASIDDLLSRAADLIRDQFGYYYVQIFLVEETTGLLVLWAGTSVAYSPDSGTRRRISPDDPSILNEVLQTGQKIQVSIADSAERRSEFLSATQAELLIPLMREGRDLGVLDIHSIDPNVFNEQEVEILEALATQIVTAVEGSRLYDLLEDSVRQANEAGTRLQAATREVEQLSQEVSGQGWSRYLQMHGGSNVGFDWQDGVLSPNTALTTSLERALNNAMPEISAENGEQILSVPIVLRGQMLGAMEFRAPGGQVWNNRSLELARIIAQRLALALDNIRLYEQAQTIASREQTANQVAARLQSKTDIDALITTAVESFQQALGATRTSIRLGAPERASGTNGDR
jgi:GAF domain-containing protein